VTISSRSAAALSLTGTPFPQFTVLPSEAISSRIDCDVHLASTSRNEVHAHRHPPPPRVNPSGRLQFTCCSPTRVACHRRRALVSVNWRSRHLL